MRNSKESYNATLRMFVRNSILLALANSLNRHTRYDDLLEILVAFLEAADLKEMAIEICDDVRQEAAANRNDGLVTDTTFSGFSPRPGDHLWMQAKRGCQVPVRRRLPRSAASLPWYAGFFPTTLGGRSSCTLLNADSRQSGSESAG